MGDKTFIDLHKETVRNVINPSRRQISLSEMVHDAEISESMRDPQPVLAISKASKACRAYLQFSTSNYVLHVRSGKLNVSNNQSIIVVFSAGAREYFVQVRTKEVYPDRINLAPLNPRFYHRIGLKSTATVRFLADDETAKLVKGDLTVRRCELHMDEKRKTYYFARDVIKGVLGSQDFPSLSQDRTIMATMADLSRGGCALSVTKIANPVAAIGMVALLESTVKWGKRIGTYSCIVVVKSAELDAEGVRLRCAFLQPLTVLPNALGDGARDFDLDAGDATEITVNGRSLSTTEGLRIKLPSGGAVVTATWAGGYSVQQLLEINEKSDRVLKIDFDQIEKSA